MKELIAKYKFMTVGMQKLRLYYEEKGTSKDFVQFLIGKIQAYNAVISDLTELINSENFNR
jgi:hypothetical protein